MPKSLVMIVALILVFSSLITANQFSVSDETNHVLLSVSSIISSHVLASTNIKVTVKTNVGNLVSDAALISTSVPSGQPNLTGITGADGTAFWSNVLPGSYTIYAIKMINDGYTFASTTFTVSSGSTMEVTISLQPTTGVRVIVREDSSVGSLISDATVSSTSQPSGQATFSGTTTADGSVLFIGVVPGSYTIQASKTGYATASATLNVISGGIAEITITINVIINTSQYLFERKWSEVLRGGVPSLLNRPCGVALDLFEKVFVVDVGNNCIEKFDKNGLFYAFFGAQGTQIGLFNEPTDIATDTLGFGYILDSGNKRIQKFDCVSLAVSSLQSDPGLLDDEYYHPTGIATDVSGNIYVADSGNNMIRKFTSSGVSVTKWGYSGSGDGQFYCPYDVAVGNSGDVYVVDCINNRIQKFTSSGIFITKWGSQGSGDGQFNNPTYIAVDASNNVYVVDSGNNRIQKFTSSGIFITKWGSQGSGDGQFNNPAGIAVDASGNVYIADTGNNRIQKFKSVTQQIAVGILKVNVKDNNGNPLPGATVTSTSQPSGQAQLSGSSGTVGTAQFDGVQVGNYTIQASKTGYATGSATINVVAGSTAEAAISLSPSPTILKITVKDSSGQPVASAKVTSTSQPTGQSILSGTTDSEGAVSFSGIVPGAYSIKVAKAKFKNSYGNVDAIAHQTVELPITLLSSSTAFFGLEEDDEVRYQTISIVLVVLLVGACAWWIWQKRHS